MARTTSNMTAELAGRGVRLTRQRRILLDVLENAHGHLRARELLRLAHGIDPTIDRATVYRTLRLLKSEGLVDELDLLHLDGEDHYYEPRGSEDHAHVGCHVCGRVREMETDLLARIAEEAESRWGYRVSSVRVEVRAECSQCRQVRP